MDDRLKSALLRFHPKDQGAPGVKRDRVVDAVDPCKVAGIRARSVVGRGAVVLAYAGRLQIKSGGLKRMIRPRSLSRDCPARSMAETGQAATGPGSGRSHAHADGAAPPILVDASWAPQAVCEG